MEPVVTSRKEMKRASALQKKKKTMLIPQKRNIKLALATGILAVIATEARRLTKLSQTASQTQMKMKKTTTLQMKMKATPVATHQTRNIQ